MSVRDHDERWDELALGHVLGGLPPADASSFRSHLVSCDQCRTRVAELRTLDSEMAAAAREERQTRREREERRRATRTDGGPQADSPADRQEGGPRWRTIVALAVTAVLVGGLALWNAHLRTQNAYLAHVTEAQDDVLGVLGRGTVVPVTTAGDVGGVVSVAGDQVAYALTDVPQPGAGERLVVWVRDDEGPRSVDVVLPAALSDGVLRSTVSAAGAEQLLITVESDPGTSQPSGPVVLEADLPGRPPRPPS